MITLVDGWRTWWRQWSTWLTTIGAAIVTASPDLAQAWRDLPPELQAAVPAEWVKYIGVLLVVSSVPAKMIRQHALYEQVNGPAETPPEPQPAATPPTRKRGRPRKPEGA